jgi:hypothetical protein
MTMITNSSSVLPTKVTQIQMRNLILDEEVKIARVFLIVALVFGVVGPAAFEKWVIAILLTVKI